MASVETVLLTGCPNRGTKTEGRDTATESDSSEGVRRVTLVGSEDVPDDAGIMIDIEQRSSRVSPKDLPRFRVTTTNLHEAKRINVRSGHECCLFDRERAASSPPGLWFFHTGVGVGRERGDQWTASGGFADYKCGRREYEPGESVTNAYRTWDDAREDEYFRPGEYGFDAPVEIYTSDDEERLDEFMWGFTVLVEEP
jgi:hypothetical protein